MDVEAHEFPLLELEICERGRRLKTVMLHSSVPLDLIRRVDKDEKLSFSNLMLFNITSLSCHLKFSHAPLGMGVSATF